MEVNKDEFKTKSMEFANQLKTRVVNTWKGGPKGKAILIGIGVVVVMFFNSCSCSSSEREKALAEVQKHREQAKKQMDAILAQQKVEREKAEKELESRVAAEKKRIEDCRKSNDAFNEWVKADQAECAKFLERVKDLPGTIADKLGYPKFELGGIRLAAVAPKDAPIPSTPMAALAKPVFGFEEYSYDLADGLNTQDSRYPGVSLPSSLDERFDVKLVEHIHLIGTIPQGVNTYQDALAYYKKVIDSLSKTLGVPAALDPDSPKDDPLDSKPGHWRGYCLMQDRIWKSEKFTAEIALQGGATGKYDFKIKTNVWPVKEEIVNAYKKIHDDLVAGSKSRKAEIEKKYGVPVANLEEFEGRFLYY